MKKILLLLLTVGCFCPFQTTFAQGFEVPPNYTFDNQEDYAYYQTDIVACIDWLESTPLDQEPAKRQQAGAFLVKWLSGSSQVASELNTHMLNFLEKNPDLLLSFMAGWARHELNNPGSSDTIQSNLEGIRSVIKVYKMGNGIRRDKLIEKMVKLESQGELEKWLQAHLNG